MKENQKYVYIVFTSLLLLLFTFVYEGAYAFFSATVTHTGTDTSTVGTYDIQDLTLSEGAKITNSTLIPGDIVSFPFTINNPNNVKVCYQLMWTNVTNTFVNTSDLLVNLSDDTNTLVNNTPFPTAAETLKTGLSIPASTTTNFNLTVTYQNTAVSQNADMGKTFGGTVTATLTSCS